MRGHKKAYLDLSRLRKIINGADDEIDSDAPLGILSPSGRMLTHSSKMAYSRRHLSNSLVSSTLIRFRMRGHKKAYLDLSRLRKIINGADDEIDSDAP
ncbi:MAG: hypothetical protein RSD44_09245, partial [Akkermansia sp.]